MANSMFTAHNNVYESGKIVKVIKKKDSIIFVLSCGHGRPRRNKDGKYQPQMNKDGLILRDVMSVKFFDDAAAHYAELFKEGDFVSVNAVAQTVKDRYNQTDRVELWGISMSEKRGRFDRNEVEIRGKITTAALISDNYILVNLLTSVEKKRVNFKPGSQFPTKEETYKSITPIGIRCQGDAKEQMKNFTQGTWLHVSAFVYGRMLNKNEKQLRVQRIIAKRIEVIGDVQPRIMR